MRILVYGAGVLGCNLANNFFARERTLPCSRAANGLRK